MWCWEKGKTARTCVETDGVLHGCWGFTFGAWACLSIKLFTDRAISPGLSEIRKIVLILELCGPKLCLWKSGPKRLAY